MEEVKAYCMKCKAERVVQDAQIITTKNKRTAAQGTCPVCGTKMFKFLPKQKAASESAPAAAPAEPEPSAPAVPAAPTEPASGTPPTT